jgi:hypothetical protein
MSFVVDTGAQGTAVAQSVVDRAGRAPGWRAVASTLFNGSGARDYTSMVIVPGLAIDAGPWQLPRRPTVTMDLSTPSSLLGFELGGLIGHNDLRRYVVTFDLIRNALRLAANE